jgi:hypothetical protein
MRNVGRGGGGCRGADTWLDIARALMLVPWFYTHGCLAQALSGMEGLVSEMRWFEKVGCGWI